MPEVHRAGEVKFQPVVTVGVNDKGGIVVASQIEDWREIVFWLWQALFMVSDKNKNQALAEKPSDLVIAPAGSVPPPPPTR